MIRVDHTASFKGPRKGDKEDEEAFMEREVSFEVMQHARRAAIVPKHLQEGYASSESEDVERKEESDGDAFDVNDPMAAYLSAQKLEKRAKKQRKKEKKGKKRKSERRERSGDRGEKRRSERIEERDRSEKRSRR